VGVGGGRLGKVGGGGQEVERREENGLTEKAAGKWEHQWQHQGINKQHEHIGNVKLSIRQWNGSMAENGGRHGINE